MTPAEVLNEIQKMPPAQRHQIWVELSRQLGNGGRSERARKLRNLLKKTQALPQLQSLTDEDILGEVEAYRNGK